MIQEQLTSRRAFLAAAATVGTAGCISLTGGGEETATPQDTPVTATTDQPGQTTAGTASQQTTQTTSPTQTPNDSGGGYNDILSGEPATLPSYDGWTDFGKIAVSGGWLPFGEVTGDGTLDYVDGFDVYRRIAEERKTERVRGSTWEMNTLTYPGGKIRLPESYEDMIDYSDTGRMQKFTGEELVIPEVAFGLVLPREEGVAFLGGSPRTTARFSEFSGVPYYETHIVGEHAETGTRIRCYLSDSPADGRFEDTGSGGGDYVKIDFAHL